MVSQYPVSSDPFTAPVKPVASKQASSQQDGTPSSFERHLRVQDQGETSRSTNGKEASAQQTSQTGTHAPSNDAQKKAANQQVANTSQNAESVSDLPNGETDNQTSVVQQPGITQAQQTPASSQTAIIDVTNLTPSNKDNKTDETPADILLTIQQQPVPSPANIALQEGQAPAENGGQTDLRVPSDGEIAPAIAPPVGPKAPAETGQQTTVGNPIEAMQQEAATHMPSGPSDGAQSAQNPTAVTDATAALQDKPTSTNADTLQSQVTQNLDAPAKTIEPTLQSPQEELPKSAQQRPVQQVVSTEGETEGQTANQIGDKVVGSDTSDEVTQMVSSHDCKSKSDQTTPAIVTETGAQLTEDGKMAEPITPQSLAKDTGPQGGLLDQTNLAQQGTAPARTSTPDMVPPEQSQTASPASKSTGPEQPQSHAQLIAAQQTLGKKAIDVPQPAQQTQTASENQLTSPSSEGADESPLPKRSAEQPASITQPANTILKQAPKADAFTKMMAGLNKQGGLQDVTMQNDPTLKADIAAPLQGDPTIVRLTGMESFARTGQVPQQAAAANAQAMAAQISKFAQKGETRFEIRLDPADLGKVDVRLTIGSDGQTRAHLFVERPETLDMFMRDQRMMERSLMQSGLNLDKQGLEFSLMDQQDNGQQMAQNQHEATDQDMYGSDGSDNVEDIPDASALQPNLSGTYVASDGVNLVI